MSSPDLLVMMPALAPLGAALLVLLADAFVPGRMTARLVAFCLSVAGLLAGAGSAFAQVAQGGWRSTMPGPGGLALWVSSPVSAGLTALTLLGAFLALVLGLAEREQEWTREPAVPLALLLTSTGGAAAVVSARDLVTLVVAVQLAALPLAALVGVRRTDRSVAATLSLLVTGVTSFGITAVGAALWYAATGSMMLGAPPVTVHRPLHVIAFALLLGGLAYLATAVPGQEWAAPAYLGAPAPVLAVIAVIPRVVAVGALLALMPALGYLGLGPANVLAVVALASLLLGNGMAVRQVDYARLLPWLSVAQSGWVLLPLAGGSRTGASQAAVVLTVVVLASLAAVTTLTGVARAEGTSLRKLSLPALRGLGRSRPLAGGVLTVVALTFAGLPPLAIGLVTKVAALQPVFSQPGRWWVAAGGALGFALGVAVTMRWLRFLWGRPGGTTAPLPGRGIDGVAVLPRVARVQMLVAAALALVLLVASIAPQVLLLLVTAS